MATRPGNSSTAFATVTTLFFAWGFITSLIDPLVAAVKGIFSLSDLQAQLSASAFFIAYGAVSFPAAVLLSRKKSVPTVLIALGLMIAGCLIMLGAANVAIYGLVLLGLFTLASGITILQVAANPLAAALGSPERSHFRLTLSQAFNSFGTFLGPWIGATLFLSGVEVKEGTAVTEVVRQTTLAGIDRAFFWIAGLLVLLLLFFFAARRPVIAAAPEDDVPQGFASAIREVIRSRWAMLGGLGIFLYVGAEVAIGTQMAFFLNSNAIWGQSDAAFNVPLLGLAMGNDGVPGVSLLEAGKAVSFYWGGAMIGRIIGSALLTRVRAAPLLATFAAINCVLALYIILVGGVGAGFTALSMGLFNSIIFPVIFTLTLERSTAGQKATSGFLCFCIVGGAAIPPLTGLVSGATGSYATAFIVPALCYAALVAFALAAAKARTHMANTPAAASLH